MGRLLLASGGILPIRGFNLPSTVVGLALAFPMAAFAQAGDSRVSAASDSKPAASVSAGIPVQAAEVGGASKDSALLGWNGGLSVSGVHDSVTGWASLWYPAVGYAFNDMFSVDATIPIYAFRLAPTLASRPQPNEQLVPLHAELGDFILSFHAQFAPEWIQYGITAAVTAPSGDEAYGLTTGRVTFDIDNHFERSFGRFTPSLSLGGGDSTTLVNRLVTKTYTSLGPLAHFQVGMGVDLFRGMSFESDAYEDLPIGDQKIYGQSRRNRATIVIGHHVTEDNGFINALDVPLTRHTTLSGYYNRSLRLHVDTVAIGLSYVLRAPAPVEDSAPVTLFR